MTDSDTDWGAEAIRFRTSLADLLFAWNRMEAATRFLLEIFAGVRSFEGQILTADLGNVKVREALLAITEIASPEMRDHVRHYLAGFDRLRAWRNYLVHGPMAVAQEGERVGAFVREIQVRNGRLSEHQTLVDADAVERVTNSITGFHLYLSRIIGEAYNAKADVKLFGYDALGEGNRPELPDELKRERSYLASSYGATASDPDANSSPL